MATLQTGTNRLQAIQRQRQLADAMAMQAMQYEPIQSPWQGAAKLAQAWVATKMLKGAGKREDELEQEERGRIAKAIDYFAPANKVTVPQQQQFLPGVQNNILGGFDQDYRGVEMPVPDSFKDVSQPNPMAELLKNLDPEMSQAIMGQLMAREMMVGLGLTDAQLKGPTTFDKKLAMVQGMDPDGSKGLLGSFYTSGELKTAGRNWYDAGTGNIRGVISVNGVPFEIDDSAPNHIGKAVTTPGSFVGQSLDVDDPTKLGPITKDLKLVENLVQGKVVLDQFEQLEYAIDMGGVSTDTGLGAFRSFGINMVATARGLAATLGVSQPTVRGGVPDKGQLVNTQTYIVGTGKDARALADSYVPTDMDNRKYSKEKQDEIKTAWRELANWDAATQQLAISIAYTLARIADPGGRLSEMDVMNQIKGLQMNSTDPQVRKIALNRAKRTFAVNLREQVTLAQLNNENLKVPPEFMGQIDQIIRETDLRTRTDRPTTPLFDVNTQEGQQRRDLAMRTLTGPESAAKRQLKMAFRNDPMAAALLGIPPELYME
jgi:hypothetical protein